LFETTKLEVKPIVIGICGGSGSGKTTVIETLTSLMREEPPALLSMDNYYKDISLQHKDEHGKVNFDLPSALDTDAFLSDLNKLKNGEAIRIKEYTFNLRDQVSYIDIKSAKVILTEGIFLFNVPGIMDVLDFSVFVKLNESKQLHRRLTRDVEERGYSQEDVMYQWNNHVLPAYKSYIEVHENHADVVLTNDGDLSALIEQIDSKILNHPVVNNAMHKMGV
jgi:uridine kinase